MQKVQKLCVMIIKTVVINTNHSFNVDLAIKYGIEEAILIENIFFWTDKNRANNKHFYDGNYWTYNSQEALSKLFPYMKRSKIQRSMAKLAADGVILKGNYNKKGYDKTTWYSLTPEFYSLFKTNNGLCKMNNGISQNEQPIPDINTSLNTDKDNIYTQMFEAFWTEYPKKKSKQDAVKAWNKIKPDDDLFNKIMFALDKQKRTEDWTKANGKFIPHPATWINGQRWLDEDNTPVMMGRRSKLL